MGILTLKHLRAVDALIIVFLAVLTLVFIAVNGPTTDALLLLTANVVIALAILAVSRAAEGDHTDTARARGGRSLMIVRNFYPIPMILVVFKEVHVVIQSMARADFDPMFIAADRWIFGADPTVWISQFSHPALTELLQISYTSYYFIMIAVGVELYRRGPGDGFSFVVFTITYGFFLSYAGYILFPGVGPRFTLHDFGSLNIELPGLFLTDFLRDVINAGESIPRGAANPLALAQRDIFPSGHTQMTLISIFFAWKYAIRSRHVITLFGTLLIISTVYLRYHYVVDLAGGAMFAALTLVTAPVLTAAWKRLSGVVPSRPRSR